jgi:hypothetical protein
MSVMGALVTEESFLSVFPRMRTAGIEGIVIAIFEIGALLGSLSCLEVGDRLGRRATVWVGMAFMIIGGMAPENSLTRADFRSDQIRYSANVRVEPRPTHCRPSHLRSGSGLPSRDGAHLAK